jgi:hypothetical protein
MIQQLYHVGQHGNFDNSYRPAWSPSGLPSYHDADGSHAMSEAEIEQIIVSFVEAARRSQAAGFDGVELFAAYNTLSTSSGCPGPTAVTTAGAAISRTACVFPRRSWAAFASK